MLLCVNLFRTQRLLITWAVANPKKGVPSFSSRITPAAMLVVSVSNWQTWGLVNFHE